jgi:hypothetical protein
VSQCGAYGRHIAEKGNIGNALGGNEYPASETKNGS